MEPTGPGIHFRIGRSVLSRPQGSGSQNEALKEFEQELQIDSTNATAAYEIGEIYRKQGQLEKSEKFFTLAVEHYPDFAEARIGLGRVLSELKQPAKALPHLQAATQLSPENEVSHYQLALVYKAIGKTTEQQREFKEFQRMREQRLKQLGRAQPPSYKPADVTKQELGPELAQ